MDTEQHHSLGEEIKNAEQLDKISESIGLFFLLSRSVLCPFLTAARNFTNVYMLKDTIIHICKALASVFQAKSAWVSRFGGPEACP